MFYRKLPRINKVNPFPVMDSHRDGMVYLLYLREWGCFTCLFCGVNSLVSKTFNPFVTLGIQSPSENGSGTLNTLLRRWLYTLIIIWQGDWIPRVRCLSPSDFSSHHRKQALTPVPGQRVAKVLEAFKGQRVVTGCWDKSHGNWRAPPPHQMPPPARNSRPY